MFSFPAAESFFKTFLYSFPICIWEPPIMYRYAQIPYWKSSLITTKKLRILGQRFLCCSKAEYFTLVEVYFKPWKLLECTKCLHQNLGERTRELVGFQDCANQGGSMSADSDTTLESDLLGWRQRIAMMNYGWRQETIYIGLCKKGKIRVQVILN